MAEGARWSFADGSEDPLQALSEIGQQRRDLDQAELDAVRAARRANKSWAEIATRLGITRQSAWERWRDLDDDLAISEQTQEPVLARVASDLTRGRRGTSAVPDVIRMMYDDARDVLVRAKLVPVNADADGAPLQPAEWHSAVVVRQYPDSGTRLRVGSPVKLWIERGGGPAGVREPRRPVPPRRAASAEVAIDPVVGE